MKEQKILQDIKEQYQQTVPTSQLQQMQKMAQFIDAGLSRALTREGEEKLNTLVTTLMNLRDFMTSSVLDNSFKARLLAEIQQAEAAQDTQQKLDFDQEDQEDQKKS